LSDIALRCGFTDQAHLCKHFRRAAGQSPAAWRRAQHRDEHGIPPVERFALVFRNGTQVPAEQAIGEAPQVLPPAPQLARD
jgi:AraC-like DNA-binding protein